MMMRVLDFRFVGVVLVILSQFVRFVEFRYTFISFLELPLFAVLQEFIWTQTDDLKSQE